MRAAVWLSFYGMLFCLVHCYSSFLPSCMALSFTEIVNQLNALSCLHGDDDDDDGVLKRARKATAKPAASSQGLFSPFFHLSHPLSSCEHCVTSTPPFITTVSVHIFFFLNPSFSSLFVSLSLWLKHPIPPILLDIGIVTVLWFCGFTIDPGPCGDVLYKVLWTHQLVLFLLVLILCFFDSVSFPIVLLQLVVNQTRYMVSKQTRLTPKNRKTKLFCFLFQLEWSVLVFNWTVDQICCILKLVRRYRATQ